VQAPGSSLGRVARPWSTRRLVPVPGAVQLQKRRGVYWLPCITTGMQVCAQAPLCAVRGAAADQEAPLAAEGGAAQAAAQGSAAPAAAQELKETPTSSSSDPLLLGQSEPGSRTPRSCHHKLPRGRSTDTTSHVRHLDLGTGAVCEARLRMATTSDSHPQVSRPRQVGDGPLLLDPGGGA
jgi:hypothetical protein